MNKNNLAVRSISSHSSTSPKSKLCNHTVQFYDSDTFLLDQLSEFFAWTLREGDSAIIIATPSHHTGLVQRFNAYGIDVEACRAQGRLIALDAEETLSKFMVNGLPDKILFYELIGGIISEAAKSGRTVQAFGEMVAILWVQGNREAAMQLEELWNKAGETFSFSLRCAYPMDGFANDDDAKAFHAVCYTHTHVIPTEGFLALSNEGERLIEISKLQQKARLFEGEVLKRKAAEERLVRIAKELAECGVTLRSTNMPIQ